MALYLVHAYTKLNLPPFGICLDVFLLESQAHLDQLTQTHTVLKDGHQTGFSSRKGKHIPVVDTAKSMVTSYVFPEVCLILFEVQSEQETVLAYVVTGGIKTVFLSLIPGNMSQAFRDVSGFEEQIWPLDLYCCVQGSVP